MLPWARESLASLRARAWCVGCERGTDMEHTDYPCREPIAMLVSVCLACAKPYWAEADKCASCSGLGRMYGPTWEEADSWQCHTCEGSGLSHGADRESHGLCSDACKAKYKAGHA